jgi:site-specific recombinase XerD
MDTQTAIATATAGTSLVPPGADKHTRHRLGKFETWMDTQGRPWYAPDLVAYRDTLLADGKAATTVSAHLSTIRARYATIIADNATRDALHDLAGKRLQELGQEDTPANRKAFVDELVTRIENATDPKVAPVKVKVSQDRPDSEHLRLTREQASALIATPGFDTLRCLRDTAIIALMLCTGVREGELSALKVPDLRQRLGGELALHVREGKGRKERLIPYGELDWVLAIVDVWIKAAGISEGYVFRGIYKGDERLRSGRLSVRAIQYILADYPIVIGGEMIMVKPHDLRRTYARRLYEAGVDTVAIQQNLGHADLKTTLGYIGNLDAGRRRAPAVYTFDLAKLLKQTEIEV